MRFHEIPWSSMRFYDVPVNQSVPTEANRDLTSYIYRELHSALSSIATDLDTQGVRDLFKVMTLELGEDLLLERSHLLAHTRDEDEVVNVG
jgi:CRISPR/Cas system endoribonuclease Cas6 (RAMP superfamily)